MKHFEIQLEIVSGCNLNCIHCSSDSIISRGFSTFKYPIEHLKEFISKLSENADGGSIYFTGGEPLLYQNLPELIKTIGEVNPKLRLGLFSSGITIDTKNRIIPINAKYIEMLKTTGLTDIYVSVYSHIPSKHDYITGANGAYTATKQVVMESIKNNINVYFNTVINNINANELYELVDLAKKTEAKGVRFLKLVKHGRAIANWNKIGLSYEEQEAIIIKLLKTTNLEEGYITIAGFPHLMPCRPNKSATGCQAGICFFYIDLYGNIYPCGCTKNNERKRIFTLSQIDIKPELFSKLDYHRKVCYCTEL